MTQTQTIALTELTGYDIPAGDELVVVHLVPVQGQATNELIYFDGESERETEMGRFATLADAIAYCDRVYGAAPVG